MFMYLDHRPKALSAAVPVYEAARRRVVTVELHFRPPLLTLD